MQRRDQEGRREGREARWDEILRPLSDVRAIALHVTDKLAAPIKLRAQFGGEGGRKGELYES